LLYILIHDKIVDYLLSSRNKDHRSKVKCNQAADLFPASSQFTGLKHDKQKNTGVIVTQMNLHLGLLL